MIELLPSILSADFARLADEVAAAERGGGTSIHVDVMDGHFVPNITIGPPVVASLRKATKLPLDCHLMIDNPNDFIAATPRTFFFDLNGAGSQDCARAVSPRACPGLSSCAPYGSFSAAPRT